ncbi:hypothetical protein NGA_2055600, partial [Nannochloropsis gaditana CCMP526]|uniref:uncharacterized protein n=1 Tax=Nannochloropsis gaditana (strain CCMP526) TaxID=1093141 RepID=UPI00029F778E
AGRIWPARGMDPPRTKRPAPQVPSPASKSLLPSLPAASHRGERGRGAALLLPLRCGRMRPQLYEPAALHGVSSGTVPVVTGRGSLLREYGHPAGEVSR